MISPHTRLNAARIRAERRLELAVTFAKFALAAGLAALVWIIADAAMATALALTDILDQARTMQGM